MQKRALISVSDKTGITELAQKLVHLGYEIISTGGTQKALQEAKIPVIGVEDVTKFPECFSGRVKTLHPLILGGVLFQRGNPEHESQARKLGIEAIDIVIVNLYPFEQVATKEGVSPEEKIEQIDIGGPTLLRAAAKNAEYVTVICDASDYERVLKELEKNGETSLKLREELAAKVFARTAAYDGLITETFSNGKSTGVALTNGMELRYGENPHQHGKFYELWGMPSGWSVLQEEKQMSYLNILDADAAYDLVCEFEEPTAACIKHANPSGVSSDSDISVAFQKSYDADPLSAFGVIVALNRECPKEVIQKIIDLKIFTEVIIAPSFKADALKLLKEKPKIRAIEYPVRKNHLPLYRTALGGVLVQSYDDKIITEKDLQVVTKMKPTKEQLADLLFAWKVVKHAKSNAIVFVKNNSTVGIGCGQTSRVDSAIIAARRAGEKAKGAVMASDAFFPFPDSIEEAAKNGISAIIQPGGSIRDEEVIAKANEMKISMVLTGVRAFRH